MKAIPLILVALLLGMLAACESGQGSREKEETPLEVFNQTIVIHDEVMPKMEEIHRLKKQLQTRIDSLQQADSVLHQEQIGELQASRQALEEAGESMMQWMRTLVPAEGSAAAGKAARQNKVMTDSAALAIQQKQKEEIMHVREQMLRSIEKAQMLVQ